jgi:hypothetical protein
MFISMSSFYSILSPPFASINIVYMGYVILIELRQEKKNYG